MDTAVVGAAHAHAMLPATNALSGRGARVRRLTLVAFVDGSRHASRAVRLTGLVTR